MNDNADAARQSLLERAADLSLSEPEFAQVLRAAVLSLDAQDLVSLGARRFEALLRQSAQGLGRRGEGRHRIDIRLDAPENAVAVQVIDIFVADRPFLVDSVLAAIRARGGTITLFAHPILSMDVSQTPWRVLTAPLAGSRNESFLHIHIVPLTDPEVIAALRAELDGVIEEVRRAVEGWRPMLERLRQLVLQYRESPPDVPAPVLAETLHFLAWLADHNFTFLGMREYRLAGEGSTAQLEAVLGSGLGILEDPDFHFLRRGADYVEMTAQHVEFLRTPDPLMVTKANVRSRVHRRAHMDYVGVKLYAEDGRLSGELRVVGLFTTLSLAAAHTDVPLVRRKVTEVMRRSGLEAKSHAGKALMAALDSYPREELFQITEDQLFEFATLISGLADRPRVRVLPRIDRFDNFVSILVYLPRDRYNSDARTRIGSYLARIYDGRVSAYFPHFPEGDVVRVHYIIGRNGGPTPRPMRALLEEEVAGLTRTFADRLADASGDASLAAEYGEAFSPGYEATHTHAEALADIAVLRDLGTSDRLAVRLSGRGRSDFSLRLKLYHPGTPIPLSDRVPMLEYFGFRVIEEDTFLGRPRDGIERYIHDMVVIPADGAQMDVEALALRLEPALIAIWDGEADSDAYNRLVLSAGLSWPDVVVLRALGRYLKQLGSTLSQFYIAATLSAHSAVARDLVALFHARHDPQRNDAGGEDAETISARIVSALDGVGSLDEDRIIRDLLGLVSASLRTNFYQRGPGGFRRPALAIKFDPALIERMPAPRPYREIFVHSPRVEGVHLRGGPIARGGLRWSDRPEDFRTEVLGLMKAQMVKNAVIVPVGAKGGFVPRRMPSGADREAVMAEGIACYTDFVTSLLDLTDNRVGDEVVPPSNVLRHDGDDPYLVVAADKGTASFSDLANSIAAEFGYWLGDAFASGGSVGYDHKKMGITARGAWEAVRRHFREMDVDIQSTPFIVAGVGDMSGDVFGNGMLLSEQIRLVAAFDHRDIFLDPDPDPALSFAERQRLFALPRSSWRDYDQSLLSVGGQIVSRAAKRVTLSPEIRARLGITAEVLTPAELMSAILRAEIDLLWFGGIGTYLRAEGETDAQVGDRANDAIRVDAGGVRAKVIGEGANLAVTQRGRIEYAASGGRINTDAIDNSAGVNSSDLEVNIKIALAGVVARGELDAEGRVALLSEMTGEVAALCLRNNYLQTLALSLCERAGTALVPDLIGFMQGLEADGTLDRAIEYLPSDAALAERMAVGGGLTRPELSVLLAYAKTALFAELAQSSVPDDAYLARELFRYFPDRLERDHPDAIEGHRLRREIIATVLSNAMINRGGPAFVHLMETASGRPAGDVAFAFAAIRDAYGLIGLNQDVDGLDGQVAGAVQLDLYAAIQALQVSQTLWFLRHGAFDEGLAVIIDRYGAAVSGIATHLETMLPPALFDGLNARADALAGSGVPRPLAMRIAALPVLAVATDAVLVAETLGVTPELAASALLAVLDRYGLGRIEDRAAQLSPVDRFDRMALERALDMLRDGQRRLAMAIIGAGDGPLAERIAHWAAPQARREEETRRVLAELGEGELSLSRLTVAAGLLSDLGGSA